MKIDLTKSRPRLVWIGPNNDDYTIGVWLPVEYENIPPYYEYWRHQGHDVEKCKARIRDEENNKSKEQENYKRNRNQEKQNNKGHKLMQNKPKEGMEQLQQKDKECGKQKQLMQQKEDEWHIPTKRKQRAQKETWQKVVWRPTSTTMHDVKNNQQKQGQQAGMNTNHHNNIFNKIIL